MRDTEQAARGTTGTENKAVRASMRALIGDSADIGEQEAITLIVPHSLGQTSTAAFWWWASNNLLPLPLPSVWATQHCRKVLDKPTPTFGPKSRRSRANSVNSAGRTRPEFSLHNATGRATIARRMIPPFVFVLGSRRNRIACRITQRRRELRWHGGEDFHLSAEATRRERMELRGGRNASKCRPLLKPGN